MSWLLPILKVKEIVKYVFLLGIAQESLGQDNMFQYSGFTLYNNSIGEHNI